jgi:hypothetical protein
VSAPDALADERDGPRLFRILSPWRSVGSTSLPLTKG